MNWYWAWQCKVIIVTEYYSTEIGTLAHYVSADHKGSIYLPTLGPQLCLSCWFKIPVKILLQCYESNFLYHPLIQWFQDSSHHLGENGLFHICSKVFTLSLSLCPLLLNSSAIEKRLLRTAPNKVIRVKEQCCSSCMFECMWDSHPNGTNRFFH